MSWLAPGNEGLMEECSEELAVESFDLLQGSKERVDSIDQRKSSTIRGSGRDGRCEIFLRATSDSKSCVIDKKFTMIMCRTQLEQGLSRR